ncbi:hypothetical protein HY993_03645 [Candidatus Micrarchaeota archaeon]|nr:hypothetical protein [Candidatus Micrarchaeota archaeon]
MAGLLEFFCSIQFLDFTQLIPPKFSKQAGENLFQARFACGPKTFLNSCANASALLSAICAIALLALLPFNPINFALVILLLPILLFAAFFSTPFFAKKSRAKKIESSLALFLKELSIRLKHEPLESILEKYSRNKNELSREFKDILLDSRSMGVSGALRHSLKRVDSVYYKRAMMLTAFSYENGVESIGLNKLSEELLVEQKNALKKFASKMTFLSIVFIATSSLLPSLFSAYAIIGSSFLDAKISIQTIYFVFLLGFPLANVAILYYLANSMPKLSVN